jgi:hypothetical protein
MSPTEEAYFIWAVARGLTACVMCSIALQCENTEHENVVLFRNFMVLIELYLVNRGLQWYKNQYENMNI